MKNILVIGIILIIIAASIAVVITEEGEKKDKEIVKMDMIYDRGEVLYQDYTFSEPTFSERGEYGYVHINEADFYDIHDGRPTIPVKTITYEFPFGTKILNVDYEYSKPETITIDKKIAPGSCSTLTTEDGDFYNESTSYPASFVSYHTGGGLSDGEHKTFLTVRVNPVVYRPADYEIDFIKEAKVTINYEAPEEPILQDNNECDLLIITISDFKKPLQKLVNHKEKMGLKTKIVTLNEIKECQGRDKQEQIKYYIKDAIETLGIKYVILVGGIKGQTTTWNLPIRYSHVLVKEGKQEMAEPEFISDLYFADIYDSEGNFSSWDSNNNDIFAEGDGLTIIDEMDLYPDVYLGRLPCRNKRELRIVMDKIIDYEKTRASDNWFKKIILISGDHWIDPDKISEGVLIMDEAAEIMTGFTPVKLYATDENTLLIRDINKAINKGAGFLYFSGHGGATAWGIHYPDSSKWAPSLTRLNLIPTLYSTAFMNFLRNKNKLPITTVGGCFNGKFDISVGYSIQKGKIKLTQTNCWAWKLASKKGGGSIATIANTGLGTHAMGDADNNGVNDYLEVLDGWMELRFLQLYNEEQVDILGKLHSGAMKDYLHTFLCSQDEMDTKMVQQWQLFGDPSLKVGGYT
jgi:hypothetical protein